jgi:hypothetical protein
MAYEAGINQIAVKVADVIHDFAKSRGWAKNDYHIFMRFNQDYLILNIFVVARALDGRPEQQSKVYHDLRDAIQAKSKAELSAINVFGLLPTGYEDFNIYWSPRLKPSEIEIDERLINQGISWSEPTHQAAH